MFVTKEAIKERTGYDVDGTTLALAQMMIEAWVGKPEDEITDAGDLALLARATTFQAVYIIGSQTDVLQQMSIKSIMQGESQFVMNLDMFAPYMSPWAILTCKNLTWMGSRAVQTGPMFDGKPPFVRWESD